MFLVENIAFTSKYTKVRNIRFVTDKKLLWGFLQEVVKIESV
jgi:hypothetical protein